jgi:hypothetical protein
VRDEVGAPVGASGLPEVDDVLAAALEAQGEPGVLRTVAACCRSANDATRMMGSRLMATVQDTHPFDDLAEFPAASNWCQRWNGRRHSFRHLREGGFDARRYAVELLLEKEAKIFVVGHHYSSSYPRRGFASTSALASPRLCGVAVFDVPVRVAVLSLPLP